MNEVLRTKFTMEDQLWFAKISGDFNPLHIDSVFARRLMFGANIVHGMHLVLWALDNALRESQSNHLVSKIKVFFRTPIRVEQEVILETGSAKGQENKLTILSNNSQAATIQYELSENPGDIDDISDSNCFDRESENLTALEIKNASGSLNLSLDQDSLSKRYPNLAERIPAAQVAELMAASRLVGMKCPGLNSVFSELMLESYLPNSNEQVMKYCVSDYDERFSLAGIIVESQTMKGKIKAFLRPEPATQVSFKNVLREVKAGEFKYQKALIVGGSRGLGEVTAKLLIAGGADVSVTYNRGKDDIQKLNNEVCAEGFLLKALKYDVTSPMNSFAEFYRKESLPSHFYYFATPYIFGGQKTEFSLSLFNNFCKFYIDGFLNAFNTLVNLGAPLEYVFCPSTVALDKMIPELSEYTAAKAAFEKVCKFLTIKYKKITIDYPRLPRLETDQTRSIAPVHNENPFPRLLSHLREI